MSSVFAVSGDQPGVIILAATYLANVAVRAIAQVRREKQALELAPRVAASGGDPAAVLSALNPSHLERLRQGSSERGPRVVQGQGTNEHPPQPDEAADG
ncbi:hypothetical protein [Cellulomonas cellasea]|uniref:Uncharacterized protein n=1 Tax=Cellulomonas cellasea TaxID=43670 RepID=A0A7W4UK02_9CELL|nr:hypothetical protein [Cellulomonas cellasea]MBB2925547.1 hypothetical protein [Cellulomonas cellasea]